MTNSIYSIITLDTELSKEVMDELGIKFQTKRVNNTIFKWDEKLKLKYLFKKEKYKKIIDMLKKYHLKKDLEKVNVILSLVESKNELIQNDFVYDIQEKLPQDIYVLTNDLNKALQNSKEIIIVANGKIVKRLKKEEIENLRIVKIKAKNIKNVNLSLKGIKILEYDDNYLKFAYSGNYNTLLKYIDKFELEDMIVEKIDIKDFFVLFIKD